MRAMLLSVLVVLSPAVWAQQPVSSADVAIEAFAQLPSMRNAELSPDGTHLAYIRPIKGRWHLVIQSMIGSASQPVVVPPVGDLDFGWLAWANEDRLVFTVRATRFRNITETTETRLWAINKDGTNALHIVKPATRRITGSSVPRELPHAQLQGDVVHWLPDEPNHILLSLDADDTRGDEIRKIDIRNGDYDVIQEDVTGVQRWMADQSGAIRLGWGYRNNTFNVFVRDEEVGWVRADKTGWWQEDFFPLGFSETANVVYVTGPSDSGLDVVRLFDIDKGGFVGEEYSHPHVDVGGLVRDPVTRLPAGVGFVHHTNEVTYFEHSLAALADAIDGALPNTANRIVSMTGDRQKVLILAASDTDAGSYYFLDRENGSMSFVAETMPGLPADLMSPVESLSYAARDGLEIPAYLVRPKGTDVRDLPLVVLPHGGPASRDDKSFSYLAQFIASRGYAVFMPNFRGSDGYGKDFREAGQNEWGGKMQEDVVDGTSWLIEEGIADADRVCIVGWSYGGYAAAMGAVQSPDLYRCAASINGVLNLPRMIADDRKYIGGSVWTEQVGLEDERASVVSPYHQAERIEVPLLIIQAEDDARVHVDQGRNMADRLRKLKKLHRYVEIEHGGHSMITESSRLRVLEELEGFLADNIGKD